MSCTANKHMTEIGLLLFALIIIFEVRSVQHASQLSVRSHCSMTEWFFFFLVRLITSRMTHCVDSHLNFFVCLRQGLFGTRPHQQSSGCRRQSNMGKDTFWEPWLGDLHHEWQKLCYFPQNCSGREPDVQPTEEDGIEMRLTKATSANLTFGWNLMRFLMLSSLSRNCRGY